MTKSNFISNENFDVAWIWSNSGFNKIGLADNKSCSIIVIILNKLVAIIIAYFPMINCAVTVSSKTTRYFLFECAHIAFQAFFYRESLFFFKFKDAVIFVVWDFSNAFFASLLSYFFIYVHLLLIECAC